METPRECPDWSLAERLWPSFNKFDFLTDVKAYSLCSSTNDIALELAKKRAPCGTVIVSRQQWGGRGRQGRKWHTPEGNLALSILIRRGINAANLSRLNMVACCSLIQAFSEMGQECHIKWPNDVVIKGSDLPLIPKGPYGPYQKIAGILTEGFAKNDRMGGCVLGIGVNLWALPASLAAEVPHAQTLFQSEQRPSFEEIVGAICAQLDAHLCLFQSEPFSETLFHNYKHHCINLGQQVLAMDENGDPVTGRAIDLKPDGSLVVQADKAIFNVAMGEVDLL